MAGEKVAGGRGERERQVLPAMATSSDILVAAMQPLVLSAMATSSDVQVAAMRPPCVPPLSAMPLLSMLSTWLSHIFLRSHLSQHLEEQVHETLNLRVNWVPTTEPYASALQLHVTWPPPAVNLLLLIQNDSVEVEGIANAMDSTSRWARTGQTAAGLSTYPEDVEHDRLGQVPVSKNELSRLPTTGSSIVIGDTAAGQSTHPEYVEHGRTGQMPM
eukprot:gene16692-22954_t